MRFPDCRFVFHDHRNPIGDFREVGKPACKQAESLNLYFTISTVPPSAIWHEREFRRK